MGHEIHFAVALDFLFTTPNVIALAVGWKSIGSHITRELARSYTIRIVECQDI